MDIIDHAIEKRKYLSQNMDLSHQTWTNFEKEMDHKKVILFGAGVNSGYYFSRYGDCGKLEGVVDNDNRKQGFQIDEFIPEAFGLKTGKKKISDISLFNCYNLKEIVVLITSKNYYKVIVAQLSQIGMTNYFILSLMEENRKKYRDEDETLKDSNLLKIQFVNQCCEQEKIDQKKIFFKAYGDYTDHGKYITAALLKLRKDLDIVWAVDDLRTEVPKGIRKIYGGNWKRLIYEMETSGIWILDLPVPEYIIKRQGQLYLQTKHWSSITLKRFYLDASTFKTEPEKIKIWKREAELIDHIITGSNFDTISCRKGFGFSGEVLQYGSPRSDGLFHEKENREKVYKHYHLRRERKVLLYAPTYRFNKILGKNVHESRNIELDFERLKITLNKRFGGEWYIFLRLHPSVATAFEKLKKPDFVIDVSLYGDSEELVSASDILVSDFSSIMFEASFVNKPVFLFATDLQDYILNEYELLIPYHKLPFPIAESNEDLEQNIMELNIESYKETVKKFLESYGVHEDGHASERTAGFISDWIQKHEVI